MKTIHFFYAYIAFFIWHTMIIHSEQNPPTEQPTFLTLQQLQTMMHNIVQQSNMQKNFTYFQQAFQAEQTLKSSIEKTSKKLFEDIEKDLTDCMNVYARNIEKAEALQEKQKAQAQKVYDAHYQKYLQELQILSINEHQNAINKMKSIIENHNQNIQNFEATCIATLQQLKTEFHEKEKVLHAKKTIIEQELLQTQNYYYHLQLTLNANEEQALIQAQKEHISYLEQRDIDEIYTSAVQPSIWPIWQIYPQNYSYQANENILICNSCLQADDYSINSNLQKNIIAHENLQTLNALAMIAWVMKKSQAEDGYEHIIGLQTCKKNGNNIACKTIHEDYKKIAAEYKKKQ